VREDHAAYITSWLTVLKNDKRAIFSAASHAQKAVDFLHGLNPKDYCDGASSCFQKGAVELAESPLASSQRQLRK
jgi:antirestriction protein ArdC